ncbi:MAG: trypsin-like serine protease [Saprospiraceae bacterium]
MKTNRLIHIILCVIFIIGNKHAIAQPSLVLGGYPVDISVAPWQASMENHKTYSGNHWCGCTILNEAWVVTAGHCLYDGPQRILFSGDNLIIHAGSTNQTNNSIGQRIEVDEIILHPNYDVNSADYEIALLHLKTPLCFDEFIRPVKYATGQIDLVVGDTALITGWGNTGNGGFSANLYGA